MDRNIGALKPGDAGFYYQFNRKDPFPHWNAKVYDINGNELTQLRHEVGSGENKVFASILCYQHDGKTPTAAAATSNAKLKGINSPFTLIYHTAVTISGVASTKVSGTAKRDYKNESTDWPTTSSKTSWTIEDPSPKVGCYRRMKSNLRPLRDLGL